MVDGNVRATWDDWELLIDYEKHPSYLPIGSILVDYVPVGWIVGVLPIVSIQAHSKH